MTETNERTITMLPPAAARKEGAVTCAYQGAPGAWSEHALVRVFPEADRLAVEYFEDVFLALESGKADYGVAALENSQTGAIGETYDLLRRFGCYIVGRTAVEIRHCLLVAPGTDYEDIREVYSHPQGFRQCERFLREQGWTLNGCRNTAVAAEIVRGRGGATAAIGSRRAAEQNGLQVLIPDIMDCAENRTTFAVLAREPEYDEGSRFVAASFSTAHRAGALCDCLQPFKEAGINLVRIESRPEEGGYRFFAELEGSVLDARVQSALRSAAAVCARFEVIGCYREM